MVFERLTKGQTLWLVSNEFKQRGIANSDEIWEIKRELGLLRELSLEEASGIRNAVVCLMGNMMTAYREMEDWDSYDRINDTMSAVVCVIDTRIESIARKGF